MPTHAQICADAGSAVGSATFLPGPNSLPQGPNCQGAFRCYASNVEGPTFETPSFEIAGGCDPTNTTCTARASFELEFPGNSQNPFAGDSWVKLFFETAGGQLQSNCGAPGRVINTDTGTAYFDLPFDCATAAANPDGVHQAPSRADLRRLPHLWARTQLPGPIHRWESSPPTDPDDRRPRFRDPPGLRRPGPARQ